MSLAFGYRKLAALLATIGGWLQSPLLLVIRVCWGWSFVQTGFGKLAHLDRIAAFFTDLGIPAPKLNALLAGSTECFGGALLLLGLGSRVVTLPLIFTMLVAYWTADREAFTSIFSDPDKFTGATPFLFFAACLLVFVFGPGRFSLDALLGRKTSRAGMPAPVDSPLVGGALAAPRGAASAPPTT